MTFFACGNGKTGTTARLAARLRLLLGGLLRQVLVIGSAEKPARSHWNHQMMMTLL
jgi:hypothetical protein